MGQASIDRCRASLQALDTYSLDASLEIEMMGQAQVSGFKFLFEKDANPGNPISVRFNLKNVEVEMTYTGEERWVAEHGQSILLVDANPQMGLLEELMPVWFSPHWIAHVLVGASQNKGITLQEINAFEYKVLLDAVSVGLDGVVHASPGMERQFQLTIDSITNLPVEFRELSSDPMRPNITARFSNYNLSPAIPTEQWNYDRYTKEYPVFSQNEFFQLSAAQMLELEGKVAPEISKKDLDGQSFTLSDHAGTPVMLIFWFPNCGEFEMVIEELNEQAQRFQQKGGVVAGLEFNNTPSSYIPTYVDDKGINFRVLLEGRSVAMEYGVNGSPTIVMIDDQGIVHSVGSFDPQRIETDIDQLFKSSGK
jgi:peroxiredoxin